MQRAREWVRLRLQSARARAVSSRTVNDTQKLSIRRYPCSSFFYCTQWRQCARHCFVRLQAESTPVRAVYLTAAAAARGHGVINADKANVCRCQTVESTPTVAIFEYCCLFSTPRRRFLPFIRLLMARNTRCLVTSDTTRKETVPRHEKPSANTRYGPFLFVRAVSLRLG